MTRYGRKRGKKFATWGFDVNGKHVTIQVRAVDNGTKFWVESPEHNINLEHGDIGVLKQGVDEALRRQKPIEWKDYLRVEIRGGSSDFPTVDFAEFQIGTDPEGKQYRRASQHSNTVEGASQSGKVDGHWNATPTVHLYVEATPENRKAVEAMKKALGASFGNLLAFFGVKSSGKFYNFKTKVKQNDVVAAFSKIAKSGLEVEFGFQKD